MLRTTVVVSLVCLALSAVASVIPTQASDLYTDYYGPVIERIYFTTIWLGMERQYCWVMMIQGKNFTPYAQVLIDGEIAPAHYMDEHTLWLEPEPTNCPEPHKVQVSNYGMTSKAYKAEFGWNQ
jgi:hypothetical protein